MADPRPIKILITGTLGQIGSELLPALRKKYGRDNVIGTDVRMPPDESLNPFVHCDVTNRAQLEELVVNNRITWLIHNAALLSVVGEQNPNKCLDVNGQGVTNVLEVAKAHNLRVLIPSSIAAFGPDTPREHTPDDTVMHPTTLYGICKVWAELLGAYYHKRWNVDFRSLRYPGIISWATPPGGGTTDYAVDIFYKGLVPPHRFSCFLSEGSRLPMMMIDDCLEATIRLLEAPRACLTKCTYNVSGCDFSPLELATAMKRHIPQLQVTYDSDPMRQAIANSWPASLDDSAARRDWGWQPKFPLEPMVADMITNLRRKFQQEGKLPQ